MESSDTHYESSEPAVDNCDTSDREDSSADSFLSSNDAQLAINSHSEHHYMSLIDHSNYFSNALATAMESIELDKSLALQAQLSGNLNNEKRLLVDKQTEVLAKLTHIQELYNRNFRPITDSRGSHSRISALELEFSRIEGQLHRLKYGKDSSIVSLFKTRQAGLVEKYPVEYNKARDKVLERQIDNN